MNQEQCDIKDENVLKRFSDQRKINEFKKYGVYCKMRH